MGFAHQVFKQSAHAWNSSEGAAVGELPCDSFRHGNLLMVSTAPTAPTSTSGIRETFLAAVRSTNLFSVAQLARIEAIIPTTVRTAAEAASAMVSQGFLTKFQAERLLAGRTEGFQLGPYVIQDQIGRGAMGRVYRAKHRTMNRPVAIKVLASELTATPEARLTLQSEIRAAAQLNHPNIVIAYDADEVAGRFYLILEYVDGPNLETLVRERGPLPVAEACELLRQIAVGLNQAHARGLVHRNLKPNNLLVTRVGHTHSSSVVKIADLGIACGFDSPRQSLEAKAYLAPEQVLDPATTDFRADLFSLGAVLHYLLFGQPRLPVGSLPLAQRRDDIPVEIATLLEALLSAEPDARPTAAEVVERCESVLGGLGGMVSFDLPEPQAGSYSFVTNQVSGRHAIAAGHAAAERSFGHARSDSEIHSFEVPLAEPTAWDQITGVPRTTCVALPALNPRPRTPSGLAKIHLSQWAALAFLATAAAIGLFVKVLVR
jgi:serine/threonine-protein kinase